MHCWHGSAGKGVMLRSMMAAARCTGERKQQLIFPPLSFPPAAPPGTGSWAVYVLAVKQLKHLEKHSYPELSRPGVASYSHKTLNHFHIPGTDMCATAQGAVPHSAVELKGPGHCWSQAQPLLPGQTDGSPTEIHSSITLCLSAQGFLFLWPRCLLS